MTAAEYEKHHNADGTQETDQLMISYATYIIASLTDSVIENEFPYDDMQEREFGAQWAREELLKRIKQKQ